jgi:hypothetical protein
MGVSDGLLYLRRSQPVIPLPISAEANACKDPAYDARPFIAPFLLSSYSRLMRA